MEVFSLPSKFAKHNNATVLVVATIVLGLVVVRLLSYFGKGKTPKPFLEKKHNTKRRKVVLMEKENLSHDVMRFRFALPTPDTPFGLPAGRHIRVFGPNCRQKATVEGEWNGREDKELEAEVDRKYSPVTDSVGYFDLMLKVYAAGEKDRFPDGGKMSQYLKALPIGDSLEIAGPAGHITFLGTSASGASIIKVGSRITETLHLGFIAGGTGLTPCLRIMNGILGNSANKTQLSLLFANQTEEDIFLREKLDTLHDEFPEQFHLWYTLDRAPKNWEYSTGFIDADMIKNHLPSPNDPGQPFILMCGPPPYKVCMLAKFGEARL